MMSRFLFIVFISLSIASSSCSLSINPDVKRSAGSSTLTAKVSKDNTSPIPIVYTIAGSDSGGGAGIQADLHAIHNMGCHGCSVITCLTAQSSQGVSGVHTPPVSFLKQQLDTLYDDLPPLAIKVGMLGTKDVALTVSNFLKQIKENDQHVWVVLDPVMISTSGHNLMDDDIVQTMIKEVFPYVDVITPNKFEAEALLGRTLSSPEDVEDAARQILAMGCKSVLIKGGHTLTERNAEASNVQTSLDFAQDYFLSSSEGVIIAKEDERLCDGPRGVWLRCPRWPTEDTHGTGCTLSSSIAAALALGEHKRQDTSSEPEGATSSIELVDACCLAKAYVSAGIQRGRKLGKGPGPVVQTEFPASSDDYPSIAFDPKDDAAGFISMRSAGSDANSDIPELGSILPIVSTTDWVRTLATTPGIVDIQLRIKNEKDSQKILQIVKDCQQICQDNGVRLWVNDHWEAALEAECFGVHVGQEDLVGLQETGGLDRLKGKNMALGISTHSYAELSAALGVKPTYISMGPVFATSSKKVNFDPQGLGIVSRWRALIPSHIPFMTIGGIGTEETALENRRAGANSVAVIGAVTGSDDVAGTVRAFNAVMMSE